MHNIFSIITAIDKFLEINNERFTVPPEVAEFLDEKGILKDTPARRGKPLRDLLRKGQIPHAYQNGSRWVIPHSGNRQKIRPVDSLKKKTSKLLQETSRQHKLKPLAKYLCLYLEIKFKHKPEYFLEHKPSWLLTYPSQEIIKEHPVLNDLYSDLVQNEYNLEDQLRKILSVSRNRKQSYDIWIGEPFNFAVEFDEKQHFNQFRYLSLKYYKNIPTNFSLDYYKSLTKESKVKPGKSGFTKLKSKDPLFPEMLPGEAQDNRIRQRAFRDFLKDILPILNEKNPTLRIPYHITNKKIKQFSPLELKLIEEYLDNIDVNVDYLRKK